MLGMRERATTLLQLWSSWNGARFRLELSHALPTLLWERWFLMWDVWRKRLAVTAKIERGGGITEHHRIAGYESDPLALGSR